MKQEHREIRAMLHGMAPKRAIAWIQSFELPPHETLCLRECDVRGKSCVETAFSLHVSPETVKKYRRRAYGKIEDGMKFKNGG